MKIGTKSILFGAHQFVIHPAFLFVAWWKLFGFPLDPRLWTAFLVHDLGYIGKPNMDGEAGSMHPWFGARIMGYFFDGQLRSNQYGQLELDSRRLRKLGWHRVQKGVHQGWIGPWAAFTLFHSRFLARRYGEKPSRLCIADKYAFVLEPRWLYLLRVTLSGEIKEYMDAGKYSGVIQCNSHDLAIGSRKDWHAAVHDHLRRWVEEHKDEPPSDAYEEEDLRESNDLFDTDAGSSND